MSKTLTMNDVRRLSCDAIKSMTVKIDWEKTAGENGDGFTSYDAAECEECGEVFIGHGEHDSASHSSFLSDHDKTDAPEECPKCGDSDVTECADGECDKGEEAPPAFHCGACGNTWADNRASVRARSSTPPRRSASVGRPSSPPS